MGSSSRHSATVPPPAPQAYLAAISPSNIREEYYPIYVRPSLARRLVHRVLRVAPPVERTEWGQPRPVADQRSGAPVGEPVAPPPLVALQREGRVSNKPGRS